MFEALEKINERPEPFQFYTASDLWTDEHTSKQMLSFHLDENIDLSSRNVNFINRSVEWITTEFNIGRGFQNRRFWLRPRTVRSALGETRGACDGDRFLWEVHRIRKGNRSPRALAHPLPEAELPGV